ncbi:hypothetical protein CTRI78_v009657 [Colletotrichum trifolii]|uniref:Uncharacterized protein n=1 Tax=Colletotrichum trifolii TaxID=5466 RepID=A0A4R8QUK1_COLTR|nr:hypothetical protein CTRI78_v009657 [Colletotrichum trifolii]
MRLQAIAVGLFAMIAAVYADKCNGKFCGTLDCGTLSGNPSCVDTPGGSIVAEDVSGSPVFAFEARA